MILEVIPEVIPRACLVQRVRDRDRAAEPELEEREREIAERETQSERHRAPAQVNEGGEVCCGINQSRGVRRGEEGKG